MRPTRATRKPDRYSPPPLPERPRRPLKRPRVVTRPRVTLRRAVLLDREVKKPKPKIFWEKIKKKSKELEKLENVTFGVDGIWRLIKSFIFRPKLTDVVLCPARWNICIRPSNSQTGQEGRWCDGLCPNNATKVQRQGFNRFKHYRQGKNKKGRFPLWEFRCHRCYSLAPDKLKYKGSYDDDDFGGFRARCTIC